MRSPLVAAVVLVLLACGSSAEKPPASPSGGTTTTATTTTTAECNAVAQHGKPVDLIATKAPPPEAHGGAIADGAYVLSSAKLHGSPLGEGAKAAVLGAMTVEIKGNAQQTVLTSEGGAVSRYNTTTQVSGADITTTQVCEHPAPLGRAPGKTSQVRYEATPTTLTTLVTQSGSTTVLVFTKQ
jgi:hypothetical protein